MLTKSCWVKVTFPTTTYEKDEDDEIYQIQKKIEPFHLSLQWVEVISKTVS